MAKAIARSEALECLEDDPQEVAESSGLRYVSDDQPGITRRRHGQGFTYLDRNGETIRDRKLRDRLKALAIPPAWTEVWICPSANGHIQATGRDDRNRKQYIYHPRWREVRDAHKFDRLADFAETLPLIRERTDADLDQQGLVREKVLAGVVQLLELTLIRIGNRQYARENDSYGLTTLRKRHVDVNGSEVRFQFTAKGGQEWEVEIRDRGLAKIIKECLEIPGYEIFKYLDDEGERRRVDSEDVNAYLREITGSAFSAKDFRTWGGTLLAANTLRDLDPPATETEAKRSIKEAVEATAAELGNTPTICRKCYIHPAVFDAYQTGALRQFFLDHANEKPGSPHALDPEELAVLALIRDLPALELAAS